MAQHCLSRSKAISSVSLSFSAWVLGPLLVSLTLACSSTAKAPAIDRIDAGARTGGRPGSSGLLGSGGAGSGGAAAGSGGASGSFGTETPVDNPDGGASVDVGAGAEDVKPEDALPSPDVPGCTNTCNLARKRCSNDVVQDCVMMNGCPQWHDLTTCQAPQTCTQATANTAACTCPTVCTMGKKRCQNGLLEECTAGADSCLNWRNPTACTAPLLCMPSANNSAGCSCPQGTCMAGDTRCTANGLLQECKSAGAGSCPDWQGAVACATNKQCTSPGNQDADCRCKPSCTIGQKKCDGAQLAECVIVDGCPAFKSTACAAGQTCTMGINTASCGCSSDTCKIGEKVCKGSTVVQECKATGPGGCGQFEDTACTDGKACADGGLIQGKRTATCECAAGACKQGDQRCDNFGIHQSCDATGGKCGIFINAPCPAQDKTVCAPNTQGAAAACKRPADACPSNSRKCSSDNKLVQQCGSACGTPLTTVTDCDSMGQACKFENGQARCVQVACTDPRKCTVGALACSADNKAIQRCEDPISPAVCPAFKNNTVCPTDQLCKPKGTGVPETVCCPKACAAVCVSAANKTTFRACKADARGCVVPVAEADAETCTMGCDPTSGCVQP